MKLNQWLFQATDTLETAGISTARLDAIVLLEDATGKERSYLLAHPEQELTDVQLFELEERITRRRQHEPLAYIRGKSEFYGREFIVNKHTLEPRPETETMIELALEILDEEYFICDIGTGSGAIGITMKLELPGATVTATDIDDNCMNTAAKNAKKLGADVQFLNGNLLEPLSSINIQPSNIAILANLPYVPDAYKLNRAATFEPALAIFGGKDGLDLYRQLFNQMAELRSRPLYVMTESLPSQHEMLERIANQVGFSLARSADFIQCFTA